MIRLRCFLFLRLARERRDRWLSAVEGDFLRRHSEECAECRARMRSTDECLDALAEAFIEPEPEAMVNLVLPEPPSRRPFLASLVTFVK